MHIKADTTLSKKSFSSASSKLPQHVILKVFSRSSYYCIMFVLLQSAENAHFVMTIYIFIKHETIDCVEGSYRKKAVLPVTVNYHSN